jgi:glycine/D-amino acid oxidase-like deaminating enzyme
MSDPRADPWYDLLGQLVVATTEAGAETLRNAETEGGDSVLSDDVYLSGEEIASKLVVPDLDTDAVTGAIYRPNVGYFEPGEIAREFVLRARERGAEIRTDTRVRAIRTEDGAVSGVETDRGTIGADAVVCAAGPWTPTLAETAGVELPVRHTVASRLEIKSERQPTHVVPKINHRETGGGFRGRRGDTDAVYRTGPTGDPGEYYEMSERRDPDDLPVDADELRAELLEDVASILPFVGDAAVVDQSMGVLSRTPDGLPIAGESSIDGLAVAALHAEGIQLAPAIGQTIAAELLGERPPPYAEAISPQRFEDGIDVATAGGGWG